MRLKDFAEIKLNSPDADFWIQRNGSIDTVGTVSREFNADYIGVKIVRTDCLSPDYLFYVFIYFKNQDFFRSISHGTLKLQHIKIRDIKNIQIG